MLTLLYLLGAIQVNAQLQAIPVAEGYIVVKGPGVQSKKITFNKAYVNWYKKASETNATLNLGGTNDHINSHLYMGWNSNEKKIICNDFGKNAVNYFQFYEGDFGELGDYTPKKDGDQVTILVEEASASTLSFSLEGSATTKDRYEVFLSGHITLHKNAALTIVTDKFGDCDPVVYDHHAGSQVRSPSDCETKFMNYLNEQFIKFVVEPVRNHFQKNGFEEVSIIGNKSNSLPLSTHKSFFDGKFGLEESALRMKNTRAENRLQEIADSMKAEGNISSDDIMLKAIKQEEKEEESRPTSFAILCRVNLAGQFCFGGKMELKKLSEGVYLLQTGQRLTTAENSSCIPLEPGWTMGLLGHIKEPKIVAEYASTFSMKLQPQFRPGISRLSVQSITIEIHTGKNLSDEIVKLINWDRLKGMIEK